MIIQDFEWDEQKDLENQAKHGVNFAQVVFAFQDSERIIERDQNHSQSEERYYCYARLGKRVLTIRFTYRGKKVRIIGAAYWRKGQAIYVARNDH